MLATILWVFLGGGLGSVARYGIYKIIDDSRYDFPLATFVINIFACFILGYVVFGLTKHFHHAWIKPAIIVGFCGGFSTFSTFSLETLHLFQREQFGWAIANVVISSVAAILLLYFMSKFLPKV